MGYKPTENYAAKDFLESGDPDKIVMGREIQADFDAISRAFTDTDNKLKDLDYVDLRGDTMTGPLSSPEVIADQFVGGDVSADKVKATNFEGGGSGITGITVDQLTDVSAPNPQRDQVLAYNGSAWESVTLDIVNSELHFKGPADLTATAPASLSDGDMYVSELSGTVDQSWAGLGGGTTTAGDFVAYSETDARWFSLGSVAGGAVTSVGAGTGIAVDSLQPNTPVVSVDRSETDSWYADKSDTEDGLRDVNSAVTTTTLRVDRNETDISDLREDLTSETEARADADAELLALIQAARPGSQVTASDDAPSDPLEGDLWYCTLDGSEGLFVWHEGAWLATDPEAGPVLWEPCDDGTFFDGGRVGVNTELPYSRLHVEGENAPEGGITLSSGGNYHTNYLKDSFVNVHDIESNSPNAAHTWAIDGDEKVRIAADGKVTLPEISATDATVNNLTVNGAFTSPGIDDNATSTALTVTNSGIAATLTTAAQPNITSVGTLTGFTSTGIDDNATSTAITIDANENVGIGTDDPDTALDVTSTTSEVVRISRDDGATSNFGIHFDDPVNDYYMGVASSANTFAIGSSFNLNNDNFLTITNTGNVGIGETDPAEKLVVNGKLSFAYATGSAPYTIGRAEDFYGMVYDSKVTSTPTEIAHTFSSGINSNIMSMTYGGNVGIGTSAPGANLDIKDATKPTLRLNHAGSNSWDIANDSNLTFTRGSSEAMRIDSAGNVGIGTTNPSVALEIHDDSAKVNLRDTRTAATGVGGVMRFQGNTSGTGGANSFAEIKGVKASGTVGGEFVVRTSDTAGSLQERMRITSAGNVGIGSDNPFSKLEVEGKVVAGSNRPTHKGTLCIADYGNASSVAGGLEFHSNSGGDGGYGSLIFPLTDGSFGFATRTNSANWSERMRLDSDGRLLVGKSVTSSGSTGFEVYPSGNIYATGALNTYHYYNTDDSEFKFYVKSNGGVVNFSANNANLSDRRTKKDIVDSGDYLSKLCQIPVRNFRYNNEEDDGKHHLGVISQEVEAIAPELVQKDAYSLDHETTRDAIYSTDLNFAMLKAIQEQQAMIETLQAEVAALKGV